MMQSTNPTTPIVVFASGRGSNFESICKAIDQKILSAKICALIVNVNDCGAMQIAKKYNVPIIIIESKEQSRDEHEKKIMNVLHNIQFDWIVLAGYMRIFSSDFINNYQVNSISKIVNIHPSLLPSFKGVNGYKQAFTYGSKITGCTIHFVDKECDNGTIIAQSAFEINDSMNIEAVESKGIQIENECYPKCLQKLFHKQWKIIKISNQRNKLVFI